jgi:predicted phage-related endonuclease
MTHTIKTDRSHFIGGSDARIIMGKGKKALRRLWREKRGEGAPVDLSAVQPGLVTEHLNRRWYELNSGHRIGDVQRHAVHRTIPWMAYTLDGLVKKTGAVFEAKFMLPWSFSEEAAAEMGHGIWAKRSKSGAVSFDLVEMEVSHASVQ